MKDIAPELLELLQREFKIAFNQNDKIKRLNKLLEEGKASYKEANELAYEIGNILADIYKKHITSDILPDGRMYYNIADRVINPTLQQNHEIISTYAQVVQTNLNQQANIGIKGIKVSVNQDKIDGIINRLAEEEVFDNIKWMLGEPVKNFSQAVIEDMISANAEFHYDSGLKPKVVRRSSGNCCEWCDEVAGTYEYPNVPDEVYRRHRHCNCQVDYHPGDGKIQDVHTKAWR